MPFSTPGGPGSSANADGADPGLAKGSTAGGTGGTVGAMLGGLPDPDEDGE